MNTRTAPIVAMLLAASLLSDAAHAALQGRDLDGNHSTFEAYYDTVLDLTWLADANYAKTSGYDADGVMNWAAATAWAANLSFSDGVNVYDNWRLPTVAPVNGVSFDYGWSYDGSADLGYNSTSPHRELAYMFYVNLGNSGYYMPTGELSDCALPLSCLGNVGPFSNLQPGVYWSGLEFAGEPGTAWSFHMYDGNQTANYIVDDYHAWAVSPGDVGAVPEAQTYALMLAGLALVGWRARRRG